jgi:hypothetical protein
LPDAADTSRGLTTAQLRGDASLPPGFSSTYWTKRATPSEAYPYSYPELIQGDIDMAFTTNNFAMATSADISRTLAVNATGQIDSADVFAAAVTGEKIVIRDLVISSAGTQTVTIRDGASTAILGPYSMIAGVPLYLNWTHPKDPTNLEGCPKLTSGNAAYAIASSTSVVTLTGHVFYIKASVATGL